MRRRFGSWRLGLIAAGLNKRSARRVSAKICRRRARYSDAQLIEGYGQFRSGSAPKTNTQTDVRDRSEILGTKVPLRRIDASKPDELDVSVAAHDCPRVRSSFAVGLHLFQSLVAVRLGDLPVASPRVIPEVGAVVGIVDFAGLVPWVVGDASTYQCESLWRDRKPTYLRLGRAGGRLTGDSSLMCPVLDCSAQRRRQGVTC